MNQQVREPTIVVRGDVPDKMVAYARDKLLAVLARTSILGPHPSTTTIENALTVLNDGDVPFEFFVDDTSQRGMVAYRRYDGHYGLILPN